LTGNSHGPEQIPAGATPAVCSPLFFIVPSRSKFQKTIRETASTKGEREGKVITKKIKKKTNKKEIKMETEMKKEKLL
jgi:hypothetical protein